MSEQTRHASHRQQRPRIRTWQGDDTQYGLWEFRDSSGRLIDTERHPVYTEEYPADLSYAGHFAGLHPEHRPSMTGKLQRSTRDHTMTQRPTRDLDVSRANTSALRRRPVETVNLHQRQITWHWTVYVGHNDSPEHPSHFIAIDLRKAIYVIEIPPGSVANVHVYFITTIQDGTDQTPVTLSLRDVNGDGKVDMIVSIGDGGNTFAVILYNNGKSFQQGH